MAAPFLEVSVGNGISGRADTPRPIEQARWDTVVKQAGIKPE
jgi:hypothetical protein